MLTQGITSTPPALILATLLVLLCCDSPSELRFDLTHSSDGESEKHIKPREGF
jgi:hypothetical protein